MHRFGIFLRYLLLCMVAAGVFGAVHDQISYSVSPEYYTRFKFLQFGLTDTAVPERLRAAVVGFLASWWMGIPLGLLTGVAGFMQHTPSLMQRALLRSLPLVMGVALVVALGGLVYGWAQTAHVDLSRYRGWYIPAGLENLRAFLCAGYMHNAAYMGGLLAVPAAWAFHWVVKRHTADAPHRASHTDTTSQGRQ